MKSPTYTIEQAARMGGLAQSIKSLSRILPRITEDRLDALHLQALGFNQRQSAELMLTSRQYVNQLLNSSEDDDWARLHKMEMVLNDLRHDHQDERMDICDYDEWTGDRLQPVSVQ